jgi:DNA-binding CsgD family transcriptional regulator
LQDHSTDLAELLHNFHWILPWKNSLQQNFSPYSRLIKESGKYSKCMALGKSSAEASKELYISRGTVDIHRKNIRKKLEINLYFELCQYARSFDLI